MIYYPSLNPDCCLYIENGIIQQAASLESLKLAYPHSQIVELEGYLMPSFIDSHSHFTQVATSKMQVSLEGCKTISEALSKIKSFIEPHAKAANSTPAAGGKDTWITVRDYDPTDLAENCHIPIDALDQFSLGYPVMIQHKSGHVGLTNHQGLALLGITPETPSPEGGQLCKSSAGELTGVLEENAFFYYQKKLPLPSMESLLNAYSEAQKEYISHGITTLQEGMLVKEMLPLYQLLLHSGMLQVDLVAYPDLASYQEFTEMFPEHVKQYHKHMRLGGVKIFLDGSPQSKTAWVRTPYVGTKETGYPTMTSEAIYKAFAFAGEHQLQLLAHCNGDAAIEAFLEQLKQAEAAYPQLKALRPVIIHGQLMGLDQISTAKALGAMVSYFVAHVYHWGDIHIANLGMERASLISPCAAALEEKLPFTFHQDSPVIPPDMWETVWCAANRITKGGILLGKSQCISRAAAIDAVTINGAYGYFEEATKGKLLPGYKADMILVDKNPYEIPAEELRSVRILQTFKEGTPLL